MNYLVTGAAGFIGSTLVDALLTEGHQVTGIDCFIPYYPEELKRSNIAEALLNPNFTFIEDNLLQVDINLLLDGVDCVFHQAGQAGVRASWGTYFSTYTDNNILATQRILEGVRQRKEKIEKVVYASSSSVYGNAEAFPTSEAVLPAPVSPYGVTKLAGEHLMRLYASEYGVPAVSLRYFTVYGPAQRPEMAFMRFINAALRGEEIVIYGDGEQSRDFTYVDDIVAANLQASRKGTDGKVYNVGGGRVATVNQVLSIIESELGPLNVRYSERQKGDASHTSSDTSEARKDFGFAPAVTLEEGIRRQIEWVKAGGKSYHASICGI